MRSAFRICSALADSALILGVKSLSWTISFGTENSLCTVPPPINNKAAMPVLAQEITEPFFS